MTMPLPTNDLSHQLLTLLAPLNRLVIREARAEVGEEITMSQFRVLALLADKPLTVSALAKIRHVSLQAMSELVQQLVARGWLEREPDARDRRQTLLSLTDAGRAHHHHIEARLVRHLSTLLASLSNSEQTAIRLALPALHRVLARDTTDGKGEPRDVR